MLETIRERAQGWIVKLILAMLAIPFALFGIESYFNRDQSAEPVAEVDKSPIAQAAFLRALNDRRDQMRQMMGGNVDSALLDTPEVRQSVADALVNQRLVFLDAQRHGLALTDTQLGQFIAGIPAFQDNGQFSPARYQAFLQERQMTDRQLREQLQEGLQTQAAQSAISQGALVSQASLNVLLHFLRQKREVSVAHLAPAADLPVSDAEVKAYYDAHTAAFQQPERVKVDYALLSLDQLAQQATATDAEIKDYYQRNLSQFSAPEERDARHILIAVAKDAPAAEQKKAEDLANQVYAQVVRDPGNFPALAKQYSKDPGSAANGGDLGYFTRDAMVKPFADAAFSLANGAVSKPVRSEFGWHIIQVTGIHPAAAKPFGAVRDQIAAAVRKDKATKLFNDAADKFNNLTYEHPDSLQAAADALKLNVVHSDWVTRDQPGNAVFAGRKVLDALFSADAVRDHHNTAPVEVAANVLLSAHVTAHEAARVRPLAEVAAQIRQTLRRDKATQVAKDKAAQDVKALAAGQNVADLRFDAPRLASRQAPTGLNAAQVDAAFRAGVKKLPSYTVAANPDGSVDVLRVSRVEEAPPLDAKEEGAFVNQYRGILAERQYDAWLASLKAAAKITLHDKLIKKADDKQQ